MNNNVIVQGKRVIDWDVDGVDAKDYPDFCDAFFCWGLFDDGTELDDDALEVMSDEYAALLSEEAMEYYI